MKTATERKREQRNRARREGLCATCCVSAARPKRTTCAGCARAAYERVRFSRLVAGVDELLEARIGTPVKSGAVDGRFGQARFVHHQSEYGILQYQIMLLSLPTTRAKPVDFVWRDCTASQIAEQLVQEYEALRRRRPTALTGS